MPFYDYECSSCGHRINNIQQKITDKKLTICPDCKQITLERLIGNSNFQLKGSGWFNSPPKNPKNRIKN